VRDTLRDTNGITNKTKEYDKGNETDRTSNSAVVDSRNNCVDIGCYTVNNRVVNELIRDSYEEFRINASVDNAISNW